MDKAYITLLPYNKKKVICFTWDDANYTHVYMALIFRTFGMHATHFLNTNELSRHHGFYKIMYRMLKPLGLDFGSHTCHHVVLPDVSLKDVEYELMQSRQDIIRYLNVVPSTFSHPTSKISIETDEIIKKIYIDSRYSVAKIHDSDYEFMYIRKNFDFEYYKKSLLNFMSSSKIYYIFGGHGLNNYGYEPISWKILWKILKLIKRNFSKDCWIPTFSELAMYQRIKNEVSIDMIDGQLYINTDRIKDILSKFPNTSAWVTVAVGNGIYKTIDLQKTNKI